jgi:3-hydroxyacyl-CoA dehydrogenase
MSADSAENALGSIEFTTDIGALKDVDFVVEAVVENIDLKRDLYTKLGELCKPETIFASNTSSLSIGEMAGFSKRSDRFLGVHFFNPVQVRVDDSISQLRICRDDTTTRRTTAARNLGAYH